jgi:hypothetical protein
MVFTAEERRVDGGERGSRAEAPRGLRKEAKNAARRADSRCWEGNRRVNGNSQFINQIGVCENHNQHRSELEESSFLHVFDLEPAAPQCCLLGLACSRRHAK